MCRPPSPWPRTNMTSPFSSSCLLRGFKDVILLLHDEERTTVLLSTRRATQRLLCRDAERETLSRHRNVPLHLSTENPTADGAPLQSVVDEDDHGIGNRDESRESSAATCLQFSLAEMDVEIAPLCSNSQPEPVGECLEDDSCNLASEECPQNSASADSQCHNDLVAQMREADGNTLFVDSPAVRPCDQDDGERLFFDRFDAEKDGCIHSKGNAVTCNFEATTSISDVGNENIPKETLSPRVILPFWSESGPQISINTDPIPRNTPCFQCKDHSPPENACVCLSRRGREECNHLDEEEECDKLKKRNSATPCLDNGEMCQTEGMGENDGHRKGENGEEQRQQLVITTEDIERNIRTRHEQMVAHPSRTNGTGGEDHERQRNVHLEATSLSRQAHGLDATEGEIRTPQCAAGFRAHTQFTVDSGATQTEKNDEVCSEGGNFQRHPRHLHCKGTNNNESWKVEDWNNISIDHLEECLDTCLQGLRPLPLSFLVDISTDLMASHPQLQHSDSRKRTPAVLASISQEPLQQQLSCASQSLSSASSSNLAAKLLAIGSISGKRVHERRNVEKLKQYAELFMLRRHIVRQQQRAQQTPPYPVKIPTKCSEADLDAARKPSSLAATIKHQHHSSDVVINIEELQQQHMDVGLSQCLEAAAADTSGWLISNAGLVMVMIVAMVAYTRILCDRTLAGMRRRKGAK